MATTVTAKGQVTLPKKVRDIAKIRPGDLVEVRASGEGLVVIARPETDDGDYLERARALARRRLIRGLTADELMEMSRGEVAGARRKRRA